MHAFPSDKSQVCIKVKINYALKDFVLLIESTGLTSEKAKIIFLIFWDGTVIPY